MLKLMEDQQILRNVIFFINLLPVFGIAIYGENMYALFYVGDIKEKIRETVDMLRSLGEKIAHFSQSLKIYVMMGDFKMLAWQKYD